MVRLFISRWVDKGVGIEIVCPNAILKRTVWSGPQGSISSPRKCGTCRYWELDGKVVSGQCRHIRIFAAYGKPPQMPAHYCCSYFERKEKENGNERNNV